MLPFYKLYFLVFHAIAFNYSLKCNSTHCYTQTILATLQTSSEFFFFYFHLIQSSGRLSDFSIKTEMDLSPLMNWERLWETLDSFHRLMNWISCWKKLTLMVSTYMFLRVVIMRTIKAYNFKVISFKFRIPKWRDLILHACNFKTF